MYLQMFRCSQSSWVLSLFVASVLASGAQAYAPIHWMKMPFEGFALMPKGFHGNFKRLSPPPELMVRFVESEAPSKVPYFTFELDNTIMWGDLDLCVEAISLERGSKVRVNQCHGGPGQRWELIPQGSTFGMIKLKGTNTCLDLAERAVWNGASVELKHCETAASWKFDRAARAGYSFTTEIRRKMISLIALTALGTLSFAVWLWRQQPKSQVVAAGPRDTDQDGGLSLIATLAVHEDGKRSAHGGSAKSLFQPAQQKALSDTCPTTGSRYNVCSAEGARSAWMETTATSLFPIQLGRNRMDARRKTSISMQAEFEDFGFDNTVFGSSFGGGFGSFNSGAFQSKSQPRVPVTILCGFLGSGKTTLVSHILRNREGLKVGVVVNDIAEANIDSEVLSFEAADGIVGLQNGCACCSGRDDLFARLQELVESEGVSKMGQGWDRLVVECSGVAEPESIAAELESMAHRGDPVMKRIFLASIICVIDASTFWDTYNDAENTASAASGSYEARVPDASSIEADRKPLAALLVNQLESSDTVIINKVDLVSSQDMERLMSLLKVLCPTATMFTATKGALPLRKILPAEPIDLDLPAYVPTLENRHSVSVTHAGGADQMSAFAQSYSHDSHSDEGHTHGHDHGHEQSHAHEHGSIPQASDSSSLDDGGHGHSHGHTHGHDPDCIECQQHVPSHDQYGLTSFVYRRDELFNAESIAAVAGQLPIAMANFDMPGVTAAEPTPAPAFQGVVRSKGFLKLVDCSMPYYWSHAGRQLQITMADSGNKKGRTQELVFIGIDMDEAGIVQALDACLENPHLDS